MTTFDEREKGYEAKLAHDEELKFRAYVRRNKVLGLWAAGKLGKSAQAAEDYANALINDPNRGQWRRNRLRQAARRLCRGGPQDSEHQIRQEMAELLAQATRDVTGGAGGTH